MVKQAMPPYRWLNKSGVTLIELMVVVMLLGVGLLAAIFSFGSIQKSIQFSKGRTMAANIAQEKMQIVMQKSYYEVLVTTVTQYLVEPSTTVMYDAGYFPPETIPEGGMIFRRYTYIQPVIENSGSFQVMPANTPDTGMRQIVITVIWSTDSGDKLITIKNVLNNPSTVMSNAILLGTVKDVTTLAAIPTAVVNVAENVGWRDNVDPSGNYLINLSPGTFNFVASAPGYYTQIVPLTALANTSVSHPFLLKAISSGTITGAAWMNNHPVISQVVASTGTSGNVEYVELYNPTTAPILMGTNATASNPAIWMVIFDAASTTNVQQQPLVYISTMIPVNRFFLISNTGDGNGTTAAVHCDTITVNGINVQPDACWRYVGGVYPNYNHTLQCNPVNTNGCGTGIIQNAGGIGIGSNGGLSWTGLGNTVKYDALGWSGNGTTPNAYETSPMTSTDGHGLNFGEAFVRKTDTSTIINSAVGNAYDADRNNTDFTKTFTPVTPRTTATTRLPVTGTPAVGAIIAVTDGLSSSSSATLTGATPYAQFSIPYVATGTWIVFADSGTASAEIDNVSVLSNSTTTIGNVLLSTAGVTGMISGKVTDALGNVIAGGITVTAGNATVTTNSSGMYFLRLSTGLYIVIANPGNANPLYASMPSLPMTVTLGDVTNSVPFQLPQGGKINGWISRDGVNPLPGVTVVAYDSDNIPRDTQVSGANGQFLLLNLSTGSYTVTPVLDVKEVASPTSAAVTFTVGGNTTWSSSFTVVGAMGTVTGSVQANSHPIKSGVLIVASTGTITIPLPTLSSATLTGSVLYAESSREDGTYSMDIRGSTSTVYNMVAFYTTMAGSTAVTSTQTVSGISVTPGQTNSGVNFSW